MKSYKILFAILLSLISVETFANSNIVCSYSEHGPNDVAQKLNDKLAGPEYSNKNVSAPGMAIGKSYLNSNSENFYTCVTVSDK